MMAQLYRPCIKTGDIGNRCTGDMGNTFFIATGIIFPAVEKGEETMPWGVVSLMFLRQELVRVLGEKSNELHGVVPTAMGLAQRPATVAWPIPQAKAGEGLAGQSRRPKRSPVKLSKTTERRVLDCASAIRAGEYAGSLLAHVTQCIAIPPSASLNVGYLQAERP